MRYTAIGFFDFLILFALAVIVGSVFVCIMTLIGDRMTRR